MTEYVQTPEGRINDLATDVYVAAIVAKQGKLNTKSADDIVTRLRSAASDMIEPGDADLLRTAAERLETVSLRVKSAEIRPRPRARTKAAPRPAPEPDIAAMNRGGRGDDQPRRPVQRERPREARARARGGPERGASGAGPPSRGAASATGRLRRAADEASRMAAVRLPTAASWNANATIEGEAREHESGHATAAHLLGFEVVEIFMDAKHGDWGKLGAVHSRWTGPIDDIEELSFARAVVAASGPFVTDSWALGRSRQDRRAVEELRFPAWSPAAWEFLVLDRTERLVRSDPFRSLHRHIVAALEELGDFGTLSGDELRAVLEPDLPDAYLPVGPPRSEAAASARRPEAHVAVKVASAAPGVRRPTLVPAGVPHHAEVL